MNPPQDAEQGTGAPRSAAPPPPPPSSGVALAVILCWAYVGVSSLLIVANRTIMRRDQFRYPMSLSGMGLLAFSLIAYGMKFAGRLEVRADCKAAVSGENWWRRVVPVAVCKAATLAFSNWANLYLSLGLIQMLKAFTPAIILGLASMLGVEHPTTGITLSVMVICLGTALTTYVDRSANFFGLLVQLGAMVTEAVSVVLTQRLLHSFKFGVWEGGLVLAPPGAAALMFTAALFEWGPMWQNGDLSIIGREPYTFAMAATLGVGVNYLSYAVIKATSSLTFKVVTVMRNIGLVIFGVFAFGEALGLAEAFGFSITLSGFAWYNYLKMSPAPRSPGARDKRKQMWGSSSA
eukprot:Hpha_TRINITY_DN4981_c0_g1::TRINITY_DN4981_c0_g1_i1::g.51531::m.51531